MQNIKLESITNWNKETKNDGSLFNEEFERINQNFREVAGVDVSPELQSSNVTVVKHNRWGQKRQVILKGKKDQNSGLSEFLTTGAEANSIKLVTGDTPFICALSGGCDEWGATEYTVKIEGDSDLNNPEWRNITGTGISEHFLFLKLDEATRAITYGVTSLIPIYSYQKPAIDLEKNEQFWFDLSEYIMKQYSDQTLSWEPVLAIFIGEVRINSGTTDIISYTIGTEYEFGWISVSNNQAYNLWHNIGTTNITCEVYVRDLNKTTFRIEVDGIWEESMRLSDFYSCGGSGNNAAKRIQRNNAVIGTGCDYAAFSHYHGDYGAHNEWQASAQYKVRVKRTF